MLIKASAPTPFDFLGLVISDYGPLANDAASLTIVEVPAYGRHPYSYSSASEKIYFVLEGTLRMNVDGVAYEPTAGDVIVVPKAKVFNYFDYRGAASRLLLMHIPPFDAKAEFLLPNRLREHDVHLQGERVTLQPMTEEGWPWLLAWNADPEVLIWSDGVDEPRPEEETKDIYRSVSLFAYNFIIEYEGEPIGECWLQKMNLPDLVERFPGRDLRRIDLSIGRKEVWGQGLGTDVLKTLVRFALEMERADGVFGMVEKYNPRSRRTFEKAGFAGPTGI